MKYNKMKRIIKIIMCISVIGIIYSLLNITFWYIDNKRNENIVEELKENIIINENNNNDSDNDNSEYIIDFDSLKEKNPDTVGYIRVNSTNINHIVVKGNDNKYYLKHNFNKEYNRSGWIFMDYRNKLDGNDKNIIIYGHNTSDGSMFGTLRRVITKEWYTNTDNYIITFVLGKDTKKYQVFSTYRIPVEDYYIETEFEDDKAFKTFINNLIKRSVYNYQVEVSENDHILTLSTCTGNGKSRMVLHAKEI